MSALPRRQSQLHLQMGQELLYLLLGLFFFLTIVLFLYTASLYQRTRDLEGEIAGAEAAAAAATAALEDFKPEAGEPLDDFGTSPSEEPVGASRLHDQPPIITLSEARGYTFELGSAELSPEFRRRLTGNAIVERIRQHVAAYGVEVIEVIGHTDEVPIAQRSSNLDRQLIAHLSATGTVPLVPADNVGLGMARAVAVAGVLKSDERLRDLVIVPYSAGQLVQTDNRLASGNAPDPDPARRRIEIRLKRATD